MTAGCGGRSGWAQAEEAAGNGNARREIQSYFDNHRQCVRALRPARTPGLMAADRGDRAAAALVAAGLVEPVPSTGDEQDYRPAASAQRWFERSGSVGIVEHQLCFATRKVSYVTLDASGREPAMRYGFSLENGAPWLTAPSIKATFPAASQAMAATYLGQEKLPFRNGHVVLDQMEPTHDHPTLFAFGVAFR